ncbi:equilibrative nucleoside transporter 1-like isoform X2 [Tigriopus californicus]|uniref:equilibrative nucleoside transporter 1-like isoform X2 n=1 Tax=Tigriopus californicus TaxID=6832 RepID=UPI0027DA23A2|nr:equilibrative nucleoside transporter 1-like isoform X2 [Tigriopus californicus]
MVMFNRGLDDLHYDEAGFYPSSPDMRVSRLLQDSSFDDVLSHPNDTDLESLPENAIVRRATSMAAMAGNSSGDDLLGDLSGDSYSHFSLTSPSEGDGPRNARGHFTPTFDYRGSASESDRDMMDEVIGLQREESVESYISNDEPTYSISNEDLCAARNMTEELMEGDKEIKELIQQIANSPTNVSNYRASITGGSRLHSRRTSASERHLDNPDVDDDPFSLSPVAPLIVNTDSDPFSLAESPSSLENGFGEGDWSPFISPVLPMPPLIPNGFGPVRERRASEVDEQEYYGNESFDDPDYYNEQSRKSTRNFEIIPNELNRHDGYSNPNSPSGIEKESFLDGRGGIQLTPSWEERNVPEDQLNFRNFSQSMDRLDLEMNPPIDRWNLIYLTLVLHGVGTLMPWNMFITAKEYFVDYKLGKDYTGADILYATYFLQYIGFAAQVPNVIFNWINVFLNASGTLTSRIVWTLLVEVIIFVITISLAMIDSSKWPGIFFYITLFSVIILNMVNGIYQNTIYGLAAKLPFKYTGAVVLGSNLSGTIVALVNIISIAMAPNPRTAAIYYFITALFILLACFDTYFALPLNRFFRYHDHMYNQALQEKRNRSVIHAIPYWNVFKKCFPQCFNVFFTFFVTLTIFPAIFADIAQVDESFFIPKRYFSALTCFLTFNLSAVFGNLIPSIFKWPSPRWLFAPILLRFFFIPFFLLCNFRPIGVERLWPVLIHWDWAYWIGGALMGLTNGYFSSMAMMLCPRSVEPEYASTAGMFGAASIVTGIFSGIGFSYLMPVLVSHPDFNFEEPSWWPHFVG